MSTRASPRTMIPKRSPFCVKSGKPQANGGTAFFA
jgi:hypothetical protein